MRIIEYVILKTVTNNMIAAMSKQITDHNADVWDKLAENQCVWSQPVSSEAVTNAKQGNWAVHLTKQPIPRSWLPQDIKGKNILCLASAGGQQAPILTAAGATVTVFDISEQQLLQDRMVAKRDNLELITVQGDMRDLSVLTSDHFDYIIHPISNLYIPDLTDLWRESYRVLAKGGSLLASFYNPILFVFDRDASLAEQGLLRPKYTIPFSDPNSLSVQDYQKKLDSGEAIVFGHSLQEQIAKQIDAGFAITGFYEDEHPSPRFLIEQFMPTMLATKASKL